MIDNTPALTDICFFTVSYRNDLHRLLLLRESIEKFYSGSAKHYIVCPREDKHHFRNCLGYDGSVELLEQNDFVDNKYFPLPGYEWFSRLLPGQEWRLKKFAGRPGWIRQQIVKLSLPSIASESMAVILDSDAIFIRPFSDHTFNMKGNNRTLIKINPANESERQRKHIDKSRNILGCNAGSTDHHYISWPNIWYADWVSMLQKHIERMHGKPWQSVLFEQKTISEYCLYGLYIEEILGPDDLFVCSDIMFHIVWDETSFKELLEMIETSGPSIDALPLCVIIQSNLGIDSRQYRPYVYKLWDKLK